MGKIVGNILMKWKSALFNITNFSWGTKTQEVDTTDSATPAGTTEFSTGRTTTDFSFEGWFSDTSASLAVPDSGSIAFQDGNRFWSGSAVLLSKDVEANVKDASKIKYTGKFCGVITEATGSI